MRVYPLYLQGGMGTARPPAPSRTGYLVNEKRVRRLGHEPVRPTPTCPYLLCERPVTAPNEVWSTDSPYNPLAQGFFYLTATPDWHSRYVLSAATPLTWVSTCKRSPRPASGARPLPF
ncbi:MAG: hypothetical protein EOO63_02400 [Hymenobacter sp.]|nr:MAG: hypothetical protein EOO63_02400 [Hymenobacter sp.]